MQYGTYRYPSPIPVIGQRYGYSGAAYAAPTAVDPWTPAYTRPTAVSLRPETWVAQLAQTYPASSIPESVKPIIKLGVQATNQASHTLNSQLLPQLPSTLRSMDPALKDDIAKVDVIIGKVCDEIMFEATPKLRKIEYFTPEAIKATCEYARKVSADIVAGLDNPSIIAKYVAELNGGIQKLNGALAFL